MEKEFGSKTFLEESGANFDQFLGENDWEGAKAVINKVFAAGYEDEAFKLSNELLLAQRNGI